MAGAQLAQAGSLNFEMRGPSLAVPKDSATLGIFQGLQRAINAANVRLGTGAESIRADGDIGSRTLTAAKAAASKAGPTSVLAQFVLSVSHLATNAQTAAQAFAQIGGVATNFTPSPAARPPTAEALPTKAEPLAPPETPQAAGGVHWAWWVGGIALLGIAGFLTWRHFSKRKTAFAGGDNYAEYDYEEAAGDFIDV
jgi:hypothetical protein